MSEVVEILKRAKERIGTPEKWCKNYIARDSIGRECNHRDIEACAWCAFGAIACERGAGTAEDVLNEALPSTYPAIAAFNDATETTHADVMALYDRAIALAETH